MLTDTDQCDDVNNLWKNPLLIQSEPEVLHLSILANCHSAQFDFQVFREKHLHFPNTTQKCCYFTPKSSGNAEQF